MADLSLACQHTTGSGPRFGNFDPVARIYRWGEYLSLGKSLRRTREHFLPALLGIPYALILGDGDGRFLAAFLRRSPTTQALAVDGSAAMLSLLAMRCGFARARCTTLQADFTRLPPDLDLSPHHLVVTHFCLDCLSERDLDRLVSDLANRLRPGALWLVSDFGVPKRQPWHTLAWIYVRVLYLVFRLLTGLRTQALPDIHSTFERHGLRRLARSEWLKGLLYSEIWQLSVTSSGTAELPRRAT